MQIYSLDYIAKVFDKQGFDIQIRKMQPIDFININVHEDWYGRIADRMMFEYEQAYLFRFIKR